MRGHCPDAVYLTYIPGVTTPSFSPPRDSNLLPNLARRTHQQRVHEPRDPFAIARSFIRLRAKSQQALDRIEIHRRTAVRGICKIRTTMGKHDPYVVYKSTGQANSSSDYRATFQFDSSGSSRAATISLRPAFGTEIELAGKMQRQTSGKVNESSQSMKFTRRPKV